MAREISLEELEGLEQAEPGPGNVREISPDDLNQLEMRSAPLPEKEQEGLFGRIVGRLLGTDVEDPLELERMGTVMGGSIGGSMLGSRVPPVPGPAGLVVNPITGAAAGGLIGAIGGAVAPESPLELMETLGLAEEGTREEEGLSNEELRRVVEGEALLELATMGTASGIRAAGRMIGKSATGITKADMNMAREADKIGIQLAPFQLGDKGFGRGVINVMGRFPILGGSARKVGEAAENAVRLKLEGAPDRIATVLAGSDVGLKMWNDAKAVYKKVGGAFDQAYENLALTANRAGVFYRMDNTSQAAQATIDTLKKLRSPQAGGGATSAGAVSEGVIDFLDGQGLGMLGTHTLGQADELMKKIDDYVGKIDPANRARALKLLSPVKGAVKTDIVKNGVGPQAKSIGQAQARLDADYSAAMAEFFETSAAKRFESVRQGGIRGTTLPSKEATRVPIDKLADMVVDLDSPQIMRELSSVVSGNTYKQMAAMEMDKLLSKALKTKKGATVLDSTVLRAQLGLRGPTTRSKAVETMLTQAGSPLALKELHQVADIADKLANTPVPNWSTFIARRASLGGVSSLLKGAFPAAALTGGAAAGATAGSGLIGGLAFFFGTRGLVGAVSNPLNARFFKEVLSGEASALTKRKAYLSLIGNVAEGLTQGGIEATNQIDSKVLEYFRSDSFKEHAEETADMIFGESDGN